MNCKNCNKRIEKCSEACSYRGYIHTKDKQHTSDWDYVKNARCAEPKIKHPR